MTCGAAAVTSSVTFLRSHQVALWNGMTLRVMYPPHIWCQPLADSCLSILQTFFCFVLRQTKCHLPRQPPRPVCKTYFALSLPVSWEVEQPPLWWNSQLCNFCTECEADSCEQQSDLLGCLEAALSTRALVGYFASYSSNTVSQITAVCYTQAVESSP